MKRMAMVGSGSMLVAAALAALPATAGAGAAVEEQKTLLVSEDFTGDSVDPDFVSLNACLTAATALGGENEFDSCADQNIGPVPESGKSPGYLQLTDAGQYDAGAVVYNRPLKNRGGIEVTFAQYQYGGIAADGISFFIVDGDTDLQATGAVGGSLGYAQNMNHPGVDGGYLGLGLDSWGNYSADTEGRGNGCPEVAQAPDHLQVPLNRAPDNVALRGPGQGDEGYCLIGTTATDEKIGETSNGDLYGSSFDHHLSAAALEDAKRLVKLKISDDANPTITVDMDFLDGDGWERLLETSMPFEAPDNFKFGFASSTGRATDVHLIRHLRVETYE